MLMMTKLFIILFVAMLMMMTKTLSSRSPLEIPTFPREESGKLLYWPYNHSMSYAWLLGSELGIHATILAMGRHATSFRPSRLSHRATFPALRFTPRYLHHCVLAQRHEKFKVAKSSEKNHVAKSGESCQIFMKDLSLHGNSQSIPPPLQMWQYSNFYVIYM